MSVMSVLAETPEGLKTSEQISVEIVVRLAITKKTGIAMEHVMAMLQSTNVENVLVRFMFIM